jgi:hypothetical protein
VTFRVELPAAAHVRIVILDVAGRVVDELRGPREPGRHAFSWSGRPGGTHAGVYFARLEVDGKRVGTRRVVVFQ